MQLLLVENSDMHVQLIRILLERELSGPFFLDRAGSLALARRRLARRPPDVIILDLDLPESQGLDTLYALLPTAGDVPIVALGQNDDPMVALAAIQYGAQDYLIKGKTDSSLLARAVLFAVARAVRARQQRRQLVAQEMIAEEMP